MPASEQPAAPAAQGPAVPAAREPTSEQPASEQPAVPADKEKPKRPVVCAFGRFIAENRAEFAKESPRCSEQMKIAGRRFKEMGDAEKADWQAKCEQVMAQYEKGMRAWRGAGVLRLPMAASGNLVSLFLSPNASVQRLPGAFIRPREALKHL